MQGRCQVDFADQMKRPHKYCGLCGGAKGVLVASFTYMGLQVVG